MTESGDRARALASLLEDVAREPWAHDFFTLMRRIDALRPEAPRTGHARRPVQEVLRFGQAPELDFAPAPLAALQPRGADAGGAPRLLVRFFGLLGSHGPMPLHFTEYVRDRQHQHGDPTIAHFLDVFHHRLLSLFYRAWAQAQPTVHLDRPADARYGAWLGATAGLPADAGSALPADALRFHAGHLAARTRHPEGLRKVLRQHFGVPVAVVPHVGHWLPIVPEDRSALGHAANRVERTRERGAGAALGRSANAGSKVWDRQSSFRLRLGPLTLAQYESFLPGGTAFRPLLDWVRVLAGPALRWDLQLALHDDARPPPRLGRGPRLGVHTWLGRTAARPDPDDRRLLRLRPRTTFLLRRPGAGVRTDA